MRTTARTLLLIFVFAIPWEYSLDYGSPWGNIARMAGLALLAAAIPAIFQAGRIRASGPLQWLAGILFVWLCLTYFWSVEPATTLSRLPGYLQEIMLVWLVGEFADSERDLVLLLRAWLGGCAVLAGLTLFSFFSSVEAGEQIRFFAAGQDPNDTARFLALGLPVAALLTGQEQDRRKRLFAFLYLPVAFIAIVATASRGGFIVAAVALVGCAVLLWLTHKRYLLYTIGLAPILIGMILWLIPHGVIERIGTIADQLHGGDLNRRVNIWQEGWRVFQNAPLIGHGAGTFVSAVGLSPIDTAHNTALSILVEGGLLGLALGFVIVACCFWMALAMHGALRLTMLTALTAWAVASLVSTTGESRTTWLLFSIVALVYRMEMAGHCIHSERAHLTGTLASGVSA